MKPFSDLVKDFEHTKAEYLKLERDKLRLAGITAIKVVQENFTKAQGFDSGKGIEAWDKRKWETDQSYDMRLGVKGSNYNSKNKVLLQTRNLYNNIRYVIQNINKVFIGVDLQKVPYAKIHNEGGTIHHPGSDKLQAFLAEGEDMPIGGDIIFRRGTKAHDIVIPKRKYLGWSLKMKKAIMDEQEKRRNKIFEKFKK